MKLSKLIKADEYSRISGNIQCEITSITTSIENAEEDALLIVLNSEKFASEDLCPRFEAIICDEALFETLCGNCSCTLIAVRSPRRAWAMAESRIRMIDYSRLRFVGVTGTNGKTTTAKMIQAMLEAGGKKIGFIGTGQISSFEKSLSGAYYSMTTPDPDVLYESIKTMEEDGVDFIIMEVSSHALYFEKTAPIKFALSLFTNISPEHLDFHGTMEEYLGAKLRIIPSSELVLMNTDDPRLRGIYDRIEAKKRSFGILWDCDCRATDVSDKGLDGFRFIYREDGFSFFANSPLIGKFNIYNALGALSAAIALGIAPCLAKQALAAFVGVRGRLERVYSGDVQIIIDYAHSEVALHSLLSGMRAYTKGSLILLFGCGGERYVEKRPMMAKIAEKYADVVYITSDNPRKEDPEKILDDIAKGFSDGYCYRRFADRADAIRAAVLGCHSGDTLLIVGKGAEEYLIDADGYHRFDEREILLSAIKEREGIC